jgi:hypothetical protein
VSSPLLLCRVDDLCAVARAEGGGGGRSRRGGGSGVPRARRGRSCP